ncbi:MAG: biotin carboxylase [Spirochaetia bacterium]|nr:biotin carboxylase [Spirochaetia bacterium]
MTNFPPPSKKFRSDSSKRRDKYRLSDSEWVGGFSCSHAKILIVCRGPIRKEAMDVFYDIGAAYGILLSEKDSVTYPHTLAPELRLIKDQDRIHRVPDYTGASGEERKERIQQIIDIAKDYEYTHIFAGYGFMAEDAEFVEAIENAGVGFIGPASFVHRGAGAKDSAKKLARELGVSVTPGIDNISALTLLSKAKDKAGLEKIVKENSLNAEPSDDLEVYAEQILQAGYSAGKGLITLDELKQEATARMEVLFKENPGSRFRLKYIGGGGGKGQRIISSAAEVNDAVTQILSESKAMGEADNRNFLMEINIEFTRHNEIQLIGNGEWCVALGGRDCSLQMHEQKLLEISITDELFDHEIEQAKRDGHDKIVKVLEEDKAVLRKMEEQAESFGKGVKLNSASTFECIVSGTSFYFMEMNTRIQVEHRVTEMVYSLLFENPENTNDFFIVESLVEAMVLIAIHGSRLPRPRRIPNNRSGAEVRLNATNDALQPHAGGIIEHWSPPVEHEIRDDQGICNRNPDTGLFIKYHLAGAYDSNIALIVTYGHGRSENLSRLSNIIRQTELRGADLSTNLYFHYGLLNFIIGLHPMMKPDTKFVIPYLTVLGSLSKEIESLEISHAWDTLKKIVHKNLDETAEDVLAQKITLITRPMEYLLAQPHLTAGWLVLNHKRSFEIQNGKVLWKRNPVQVLKDLYHFLQMEERSWAAPASQIWDHDCMLLKKALEFYNDLEKTTEIDSEKPFHDSVAAHKENQSDVFLKTNESLLNGKLPSGIDASMKDSIIAAHKGWQLGMNLLDLIPLIGEKSGILKFSVGDDLQPIVPDEFKDAEKQKDFIKALAPPPVASSDEIVALMGGMFYSRETPTSPPFVSEGGRFEIGQPLYIVEVMKMFNRVNAEFSGTIEKVLLDGNAGEVVRKGQPLFKVKPDEASKIETPEEKLKRKQNYTKDLMKNFSV